MASIERLRGASGAGGRDIRMQGKRPHKSLDEFKKSYDYISLLNKPKEREAALNAKKTRRDGAIPWGGI
jgi:hypothetical protein